jgi:serine/threonine-protein kinase
MASVYRALDKRLQRQVAVKVLSPVAAHTPGLPERFLQEARLVASLRHPNIVTVYDYGEQGDHTYMVQELLAGPTLADQLKALAAQGQVFSREQVLAIMRQLTAALDAAHAAGIIHRDVKPSNAIWNERGELVLTDFGIAKNTQLPTEYTQAGMVIGTPDYLSPEQARNLPLTPSSDLYSLGVVLFELLAGQTPFHSDTPLAAMLGHMQEAPPPLRPRRPDLPPAVERVVLQALAKDPAQRFRSGGALVRALEQAWAPGAAAGAAVPALHDQTTHVWASSARPATPIPVAPPPAPPLPQASAARPQPTMPPPTRAAAPAPAAPARSGHAGGRCMLVTLLLLGLIGLGAVAAALFLNGALGGPSGDNAGLPVIVTAAPAEQPTEAPVEEPTAAPAEQPTEAPAEQPSETPAPIPTETPPAPTETPAPIPTEPPPAPTAAPPEQLDPSVDQLRELVLAGQANGQAGKHADELVSRADDVAQALADGNKGRATSQLRNMQRRIAEDARDKDIDLEFARRLLDAIDAVARAYDLKLPGVKLKD